MQNAYTAGMARTDRPFKHSVPVSLRVSAELDQLIDETAREVRLSRPETIRLSIERGAQILKRQLTAEAVLPA